MVSDSPPPLDDDTWNDDDEDDFADFASVTDHNIKSPSSDRGLCLEDNVDFGVFKGFSQYNLDRGVSVKEVPPSGNERPVLQTLNLFPEEETRLTNGKPRQDGILSKDNDIEFEQISCDTKTLGYLSNFSSSRGRDSMTDSGHCSTDISPVPKSDESPDSGDKSSSSELEETYNGEIGHKANGQLTSDHCEEEEEEEEEEISVVKLGDKTGCDKDKTSKNINGNTGELPQEGGDLPPDFSCASDKEDESYVRIGTHLSARTDEMSAENGSSPSLPSSPPPPDFPPPARPDTPDMVAQIRTAPDESATNAYMLLSSEQPGSAMVDDFDDWADFSSAPSFGTVSSNDLNLSTDTQPSLNPSISSTTKITTVTTVKDSSVSPTGSLRLQTAFRNQLQEDSSASNDSRQTTVAETAAQDSPASSSIGFNADFRAWNLSNHETQSDDRKIEVDFPSQDESLAESSTDYEDTGPDGCDLRSNDSLDESYSISDHVKTVELKYSTEENQDSDDDDEFGDFGTFHTTETNLPSNNFVPKTENLTHFASETQSDEDEFCNFSEFSCNTSLSATVNNEVAEEDDDDDDWADFATPPPLPTSAATNLPVDPKVEFTPSWGGSTSGFHTHSNVSFAETPAPDNNKDNDDWANFSTAQPTPACTRLSSRFDSYTDTSISSHKFSHSKVSNAIVPVLNKCFPETMSMFASAESSHCGLLKDLILDEIPLRKSHRSQKTKARSSRSSCCVWKQLLDVDVTDALAYHFTDSKGSNVLYRTLCIDSRKILMGHKKPGVPIFAANLGMLEPSKVTGNDASKSTNLTGSTLSQDTLIDTYRSEPRETLGQADIPPVLFDWSSSGLTNPLEQSAASANTLDLDFLVVKDSLETSTSRSGGFESELLAGPLKPLPSFKPMQPLEDMLANSKSTTMKQCQPDEHLTSEATKVIQTLPDLSFMHAKVLMFPVRQSSQ